MVTNIIQFLHTTASYQTAVFQLMVGEANLAAKQLDLSDSRPLVINQNTNEWNVSPPPMGIGGSVLTSNYIFEFQKGQLAWVKKTDWFQKVTPPITNLVELASRRSLLDSNSAYQLATQWLSRLSVDVNGLERRFPPNVFQVPARRIASDGSNLPGVSNNIATPLFKISWGDRKPPMDMMNPVRVEILGTTKELLDLSIRDASLFKRPPIAVTNIAELLGPLPPARHFVEELFGGSNAYAAVKSPDHVEAWLLNTFSEQREQGKKPERAGPMTLKPSVAKTFSGVLLDFDTYQWGVMKACAPQYGLRLRFVRAADSVEILFCYECDILQVTHNGRTKEENFDFAHNKLVKAVQNAFPKDEIVRKLELNDEKQSRKQFEGMLKSYENQNR